MSDEDVKIAFGAQVTDAIAGVQEVTGAVEEGTAQMKAALAGLEASVEALLAPFAALFAVVEGAEYFGGAVKSTVDFARELQVLHEKTGVSVEDLSRLGYAAQMSEVGTESLTIGLQRLARAAEESVRSAASPAALAFQELGIRATTASGQLRPLGDLLLDIAQKFSTMPDSTTKAALAMDLFGRSGTELIPLLNRGKDGIAQLEQEADRLGYTMTNTDVQAALQYEEAMRRLKAAWDGVVRTIVVAAMPALEKIAEALEASIFLIEAFIEANKALALWVALAPKAAQIEWQKAIDKFHEAMDAFKERVPAQAAGGGGEPPVTVKPPTVSALDKMREEWNKLKEEQLGTDNDLLVMEIFFWQKKLATATAGSKDYLEIHNHIVELETELAKRSTEEEAKAQKAIADGWMKTFEQIPSAWDSAVRNMQQTSESFAGMMADLFDQLLHEFLAYELKSLEQHEATELAKQNITAQSALARVASESAATAEIIAMHTVEVAEVIAGELLKVAAYAATAAAAAWSAIAGIPFVGPFLAPAIAAATLAGVLALAHGGSGGGGVSAPSQSASPSQGGSSSSGGTVNHITINAIDTQSFHQALMKNSASVAKASAAGALKGVLMPTAPGRGS